MAVNNPVNIQIGNLSVTLTMDNGEVTNITAQDQNGNSFDVGFVLEPIPINGGGCQICRYVNGRKVCWEIDCLLLVAPVQYEKPA